MGGTIHRLAVVLAAASALSAAELPAGVPTYRGVKPAPKEIPAGVPAYRGQPGAPMHSPHLTRPGMNAPRPGVAIPGTVPNTRQRSQKTAQAPKDAAAGKTNPKH